MAEDADRVAGEPDPWTGRVLDRRYRVGRVLGEGGMGSAFLAVDERMEREVVVKRPHVGMLADRGFRERFAKEVKAVTRLEHPHVLKVLDSGETEEGVPYAVFPFLPGGSLRERLSPGERPSVADLRSWLPQVAAALDYVHSQGFVHRDVKPGNVLFDGTGHPYLADFGLAKPTSPDRTRLTTTGAMPGSPEYMAPEAISGAEAGPAYDQYALGVVVYESLAGTLPHEGRTALELFVAKKTQPPRPLSDSRPDIPGASAAAVMRALEKEPEKRHDSCTGFVLALDAGAPGIPGASPARAMHVPRTRTVLGGLPGVSVPPRNQRRRLALIAAGAILLGGGAWLAFGRGGASGSPAGTPPTGTTAPLSIEVPLEGQVALPGELVVVRGFCRDVAEGEVVVVDGKATPQGPEFFETTVRLGREAGPRAIEVAVGPKDGPPRLTEKRTLKIEPPKDGEVPEWAHISWRQVEEARRLRVPVAFENSIGMRFVLIPAGTYDMGAPADEVEARTNENLHRVTLTQTRYEQATETTNAQFRAFRPEHDSGSYRGVSLNDDLHPAVRVTHADAKEFAAWVTERSSDGRTYRVPTEAEWEQATRAGTRGPYFWGPDFREVATFANLADRSANARFPTFEVLDVNDGFAVTAPVASLAPNPWGLWDTIGNAGEWCADWLGTYPEKPVTDPTGDASGAVRIVRGACFSAWGMPRSAHRGGYLPDGRDPDDPSVSGLYMLGVRLVAEVPPPLWIDVPKEGQPALRGELVVVRGFCRDLAEGQVVTVDGKPVAQGPEFFETTVRLGKEDAKSIEIAVGPKGGPPRLTEKRTLKIETPKDGEVPEWAHVSWQQVEEARRLKIPVAFENSIGMRFVLVPAGTFRMGSPADEPGRTRFEGQRRVTLSKPFYVQATEATNAQVRPWRDLRSRLGPLGDLVQAEGQPAIGFTHDDATEYAASVGVRTGRPCRLPTEAEWEYAARAGARARHWWGDDRTVVASHENYADASAHRVFPSWTTAPGDDGHAYPAPAGSYDANAWGLHDVLGNAAEWCADRGGEYLGSDVTDPRGPEDGPYFVARGGGWNLTLEPISHRLATRTWLLPDGRGPSAVDEGKFLHFIQLMGVRLVADVPPPLAVEVPKEGQSALRGELVVVRGFCRDLAEGEVIRVDGKPVPQGPEFFETTVRLAKEDAKSIEIAVGPKDDPPRLTVKRTLKIETPKEGEVPEWAHVSWRQVEEARRLKVSVAFENSIGMRFVLVPAGTFLMGSPLSEEDRSDSETPHRVTITRSFYAQATEVTNAQMRRWKPERKTGMYQTRDLDGDDQPAGRVTWDEAAAFAAWATGRGDGHAYRLPSEAEWEFAARAGAAGRFWWGDDASLKHRHENLADRSAKAAFPSWRTGEDDDGFAASAPVASFDANAWGLFDSMGNVREWVSGWFEAYRGAPETDPQGPPTGTYRGARGSTWSTSQVQRDVRLAKRRYLAPDGTEPEAGTKLTPGEGLRLFADLPPPR